MNFPQIGTHKIMIILFQKDLWLLEKNVELETDKKPTSNPP